MVHSEPGTGTILTVELPLSGDDGHGNGNLRETDSHLVS
jgi:hypothetical protein